MEIKVSVIMPSLNVRNYIEEAVRSVMGQTLREIEIICIDAGSSDGTWEILSSLAEGDERIVLCSSDKKSYGYQVNLGLDMARGEYVAVVETDDYVTPEMYGRLFRCARERDCDYVKSDYDAFRTQEGGERLFIPRRIFSGDGLYDRVITPKEHPETATGDWYLWNGIYRREFLLRNGIRLSETTGAAFQDIGFLFWTSVYAGRALYLKDSFYRYRTDREGASSGSGRGLVYSCREFRKICDEVRAGKYSGGTDAERPLYCRMAGSYVSCCGGTEAGQAGMTETERAECHAWFRGKLGYAVERGIVNRGNVRPEIWKKLNALLAPEEGGGVSAGGQEENIRKTLGGPGEYPVVVFGCGYYGGLACRWLREKGYRVACFTDNNKELWGGKVDGIVVKPPGQAGVRSGTVKYLIASERYSEEIRVQLMGMGVMETDICEYV